MVCLIAAFFSGCDSGTKWKSGPYEVYWIDLPSDLTLGLSIGDGNAIGRVMPQVFAVGENDQWIVAARFPRGDRSKREYFYIEKAMDHSYLNADEIVKGPFTKAEFDSLKAKLSLPEFAVSFE